MADFLFPPGLVPARVTFRYLDATGLSVSPYTGVVRTASLGGDRVGCTIETTMVGSSDTTGLQRRAQLLTWLGSLRGKQNRALIAEPVGRVRGSFPTTELISNGDFSNGTTGWLAGSLGSLSVADRALRVTRIGNDGSFLWHARQLVSVAAYTPYVFRAAVKAMANGGTVLADYDSSLIQPVAGNGSWGAAISQPGLTTAYGVTAGAVAANVYIDNSSNTGMVAGSYFDISWASLTRCILVDAPNNALTYSDQFDNAAWTKTNLTISANSTTAPDGTTTADTLTPTTAASVNHIATNDGTLAANGVVTVSVAAKANGYNFISMQIRENTSSTLSYQTFNLSTGAVGTTNATGANWADRRASITALGNGWYLCTITCRNTNNATSYTARLTVESTDNVSPYTADGTSGVYLWRATLKQEAVPGALVQTTSAAVTGATWAAGASVINVKGLPASTQGLLLPGDWFEVLTTYGSELKQAQASLDGDAAGRGVLPFVPPLRGAAADNQPIIVVRPTGRFVYTGNGIEWPTDPGILTSASLDFEEAVG